MSMKKLLACLLALMMALALVACGGDTAGDDANVDDRARPWRMTPIPEQAPALRWRP